MVIIKNSIKTVVIPLAVTSFMVLQSCKEDESTPEPESKTDLLIGDWEVTEVGGDDFTSNSYSYLFKFKSSGDWQFCYEHDADPAENYCYSAEWKWEDSSENTIIIDQFSGDEMDEWRLDVTILNESKLEGSITSTYDDGGGTDSYTQSIKFVKVN